MVPSSEDEDGDNDAWGRGGVCPQTKMGKKELVEHAGPQYYPVSCIPLFPALNPEPQTLNRKN